MEKRGSDDVWKLEVEDCEKKMNKIFLQLKNELKNKNEEILLLKESNKTKK